MCGPYGIYWCIPNQSDGPLVLVWDQSPKFSFPRFLNLSYLNYTLFQVLRLYIVIILLCFFNWILPDLEHTTPTPLFWKRTPKLSFKVVSLQFIGWIIYGLDHQTNNFRHCRTWSLTPWYYLRKLSKAKIVAFKKLVCQPRRFIRYKCLITASLYGFSKTRN
jgi:hypothetical protein